MLFQTSKPNKQAKLTGMSKGIHWKWTAEALWPVPQQSYLWTWESEGRPKEMPLKSKPEVPKEAVTG